MRKLLIIFILIFISIFSIFNTAKYHFQKFSDFLKARNNFLEAAYYIEYYGNFLQTGNISSNFLKIIRDFGEIKDIQKLKKIASFNHLTYRSKALIFIEIFRYYRNVNFANLGEPYLEKALDIIQNSGDIKEKLEIMTMISTDYASIFKKHQSEKIQIEILDTVNQYSYHDYIDNPDIYFKAIFLLRNDFYKEVRTLNDIEKYFIENDSVRLSDFYYYFTKYIPEMITNSQKKNIFLNIQKYSDKKKPETEDIFILTNLIYSGMRLDNNLDTFNYLKKYFRNNCFDDRIIDIFRLCIEKNDPICAEYIYDNLILKYGISSFLLTSIKGNKLIDTGKHIEAVKEIYRTYQDFRDSEEKNPEYIKFLARSGELDKAIECSEFYYDSQTLSEIGKQMIFFKKRSTPYSLEILRKILKG